MTPVPPCVRSESPLGAKSDELLLVAHHVRKPAIVMAGFVPAMQVFPHGRTIKPWIPGPRPG